MKDRNYLLLLSSWALIQGFFQTFLILFVRQVRPTLTENVNMNIGYIMLIVFVRNRLKNISSIALSSVSSDLWNPQCQAVWDSQV